MYKIRFLITNHNTALTIASVWDGPIISIRNHKNAFGMEMEGRDDYLPAAMNYHEHLQLYFDDFVPRDPITSSTMLPDIFLPNIEQIFRLVSFSDTMIHKGRRSFLIHCDGGVSRSPAVALGLGSWYNGVKIQNFERHVKNFRLTGGAGFTPNAHVLWLMDKYSNIAGFDEWWNAPDRFKPTFTQEYVDDVMMKVERYHKSFAAR
jgi:predicted protein tyrosine phosphatase